MGQLVTGAPGLYLRGLPTEPVLPLSGIPGLVGIASRGPLHQPQLIRSWDEYVTVFGDLLPYGFLSHEVFGFFRNGGSRCFVVRVADLTDYSADNPVNGCRRVDLLKAAASGPILDAHGDETMRIAAIDEGAWGNGIAFEVQAGTQPQLPLTTIASPANAGSSTIVVAEPYDLVAGTTVQLAPPGDPLRTQIAVIKTVDSASDTVTLLQPLGIGVTRGTVVAGRGFTLIVRCGERGEVFDNLSMSPTNARYFMTIVNGSDASLWYIDRQQEGSSILVRVNQVFDGGTERSRLRPAPAPGPHALSGGGDGFRYASATFKDVAKADSIRVFASASASEVIGSGGNTLRVRARPFATATALAVSAGVQTIVVENAAGITTGDDLTLKHPTTVATETHPVASVGAGNAVTLNTGGGGLTNAYPSGALVTIKDRFTLSVFKDPIQPVTTTIALPASIADTSVVLDGVAAARVGDRLTIASASGAAETYPMTSVDTATNTVGLDTGGAGLVNAYPVGSPVTLIPSGPLALEPSEIHANLSADPNSGRYVGTVLAASTLLCGEPAALLQPPDGEVTLVGGRDPGNIDFRWYTGYDLNGNPFVPPGGTPGRRYGLASLETIDEIDLVASPDLAAQTLVPPPGVSGPQALYLIPQRHLLLHAARLGDRVALLDARRGTAAADVARLPQQLADPETAKFGALYYPWLEVSIRDDRRLVPPSGFVAGAIARADADGGVGRAPANLRLLDVVDLDVFVERQDQDVLNPAAVNAIRRFEAPALELWGARTLSSDPASRYLHVRRLVIAVKKAIARTLLWTVFEPNGPTLRRRIEASLRSLLQTLVAGGATPAGAGAFFVQCDDANNPPELADAGQVVAVIGIALTGTAEFIVINVKRTPDAVSVSEQAG